MLALYNDFDYQGGAQVKGCMSTNLLHLAKSASRAITLHVRPEAS
jgi:hypothetical protein